MATPLNLLILEDRASDAELMAYAVAAAGFELAWQRVESEADYLAALEKRPDLILADYNLPQYDGITALQAARERGLDIPFIIVSGSIDEERAVNAMRNGASDYVLKDRMARLGPAAVNALEQKRLRLENQRAAAALAASAARFRALVEHSSDAIALLAADGTILYESPAATQILGYAVDDLLSTNAFDYLHPEDMPVAAQLFHEINASDNGPRRGEFRYRHKEKGWRWIEAVGTNKLADPGIHAIVVNYRDITERKRAEEALMAEHNLLRTLIDNIPDHIYVKDTESRFLITNLTDARSKGASPAEVIGKSDADYYQSDLAARYYADDQLVVQSGQPLINREEPVLGADGIARWILTTKVPWRDSNHQVMGLVGIGHDITARKQAEESLRQRLAELEALHTVSAALRTAQTSDEALPLLLDETLAALETDAGTIWLYDPQADELRAVVARGWFQQYGKISMKTNEGIAGVVFRSGESYLSAEFYSDPLTRAAVRGQVPAGWGGVAVSIRTGTVVVGVLFVAVPHPRQIRPEQVKLLESLAEMGGVTLHRMRLRQQTEAEARRVQAIMETSPAGMLLLDGDGRILLSNPMAVRALGLLAAAGAEQPLTHLGDRALAELLAPPTQGSWHTVQAGGRTFEAQARPMAQGDGRRSWVLVLNDVTSERERQRYQEAQERLAVVGQLAAGIAHDFNNVMGVIVLYATMLRDSASLSSRQQRQVETIHGQAQHAAALISQILDFSRRSVMERAALDLLPLLKEMVALLDRTLPESIHLELAYDRSEYIVNGDPTRLQQVLMNLAVNARDALPNGGRLTFTCSALSLTPDQAPPLPDMAAGLWLSLAVTDTGTGISAAALTHIFEPFFTTKEPGKGTGLGLAQVYGIVKQHDGHIAAQTQEGKGTTFTLYLPLLMTAALAAPAPQAALVQGQGEMILVVEDNPNMRMALVEVLEAFNYRVLEAVNGRAALAILEQQAGEIDLVLSDLVMPEMGGQALLEAMRARGLRLPLVVLSGHPLTNEMQAMQAQGLAGWLLKPPDIDELAALLARALGQAPA